MKGTTKKVAKTKPATKGKPAGLPGPTVEAVFKAYPKPVKAKLLALRRLIFDIAKTTEGVGALQEILKWGQPSYLTPETKSGSTIRIDQVKSAADQYAVYFHGHPVERIRERSRSGAAPLRGAGTDLSSQQAQIRALEITGNGNRQATSAALAAGPMRG